jgi:Terpene cyclase DEP1
MNRPNQALQPTLFGVVVPYAQFIPWLSQNGLQVGLFERELFATRIEAFFGLDVVASAVVLFVFICAERKIVAIRHAWLPIIATFVAGVSLGLPLFLYMRPRVLDSTAPYHGWNQPRTVVLRKLRVESVKLRGSHAPLRR